MPIYSDSDSFAVLLAALPEAAVVADARQDIVYVNEAFAMTTGYTLPEVRGRNCRLLQGPGTDHDTVGAIREALSSNTPYRGRLLNYRKDATPFWNEIALAPVTDRSGVVTHYLSLQRDATDSVRDRAGLVDVLRDTERDRATLSALLDVATTLGSEVSTVAVAQAVADAILRLCDAPRSAVAVWDSTSSRLSIRSQRGWPRELAEALLQVQLSPSESPELAEVIVQRTPVLVRPQDSSLWAQGALERFGIAEFAAMPVHSRGELRGLLLSYWTVPSAPDGFEERIRARLSGLAGLTAIALENARLIEEAQRAAAHDQLTGLPNRAALEQQLAEALHQVQDRAAVAVIFCDVDGLKHTNDTLGHDAGDRVLQEVADRIRGSLRPGDTVSRVGGDEFVIVLTGVQGEEEVAAVVERLEHVLAGPLVIGDRTVAIRLSMGLAFSSEAGLDLSAAAAGTALIRAADLAMYQRKGRQTTPLSEAPLGRLQILAASLPGAVDRQEITVHYQPQVNLQTGRPVAVEALARWTHPVLGAIEPEEFIPLAEMNGDIRAIGGFVLEQACTDMASLRRAHPELQFAVNVSTAQLDLPGFASTVLQVLTAAALPAGALTVEITETRRATDRVVALAQLQQLRAVGVGVALDDFGTGYTSLTQLQDLPVTELKVDRTFVQRPPADGVDLLAGIVGLAHGLSLRVVAEGVSDISQLERVRDLGFDCAQGFAIAAPMDLDSLARYLDDSSPDA